jgi:hypothetical protein
MVQVLTLQLHDWRIMRKEKGEALDALKDHHSAVFSELKALESKVCMRAPTHVGFFFYDGVASLLQSCVEGASFSCFP